MTREINKEMMVHWTKPGKWQGNAGNGLVTDAPPSVWSDAGNNKSPLRMAVASFQSGEQA